MEEKRQHSKYMRLISEASPSYNAKRKLILLGVFSAENGHAATREHLYSRFRKRSELEIPMLTARMIMKDNLGLRPFNPSCTNLPNIDVCEVAYKTAVQRFVT